MQRARFGVADMAGATAARAGDGGAFAQRWTQPLAAHLHQTELADGAELHPGAVLPQRVAQPAFHFAPVTAFFHVDEVDHDQAAQVTQAHLACHLVSGFQVGAGRSLLNVAATDGAGRVHVDRDQGLGVVDHNRAAAGQLYGACIGRFDLVLDLETREQRGIVAVAFDPGRMLWHHVRHELLGLVVHVVGVDQDVADVMVEVVPDGAYHQAGFLVDEEGAFATFGGAVNRRPELEQVVQVPLQLRRAAADASGAGNDAHAVGVLELVQRLLEVGAVFALDAARHTAAPRVIGHQHHIAAGQRHQGGQRCALVAALFFFHLHQQFLAFANGVLDAGLVDRNPGRKVLPRDLLEWQKAVPVFAVVDKAGLQRGLDPGHHSLVNIALALFAPLDLDFVIEQFLSIDNGQAAFFSLRGVDQHPFHG